MRRYVTELIGTFFLVLTVCCVSLAGAPLGPVAIGAVLMVMIFAGGHISGGHYNPAVTLAVYLRGKLSLADVPWYMGAQLVGGLAAAGLSRYLVDADPVAFKVTGGDLGAAFVAELVFTFALAYVVLNVATSKDHPNNSFYGLAIGFTVLAGAVAVGGVSGGAFNPAVGLGISVAGLADWSMIWIYLIATLAGGAAAAYAFRYLNPDDMAPDAPAAKTAPAKATRIPSERRG
ncbi:MAG TPA: aquaporin [Micromonosporaceae bacterium]|nr:aquaporin [Micromonosporaceae bacterium]